MMNATIKHNHLQSFDYNFDDDDVVAAGEGDRNVGNSKQKTNHEFEQTFDNNYNNNIVSSSNVTSHGQDFDHGQQASLQIGDGDGGCNGANLTSVSVIINKS